MENEELIYFALNTLENEIPIKWDWRPMDIHNDKGCDGKLSILLNDNLSNFNVEIKKNVNNYQLFNIIYQKRNIDNFLLIAEKLYPKVKTELKNNNINYIEANGNVYINQENIYLYINDNKTSYNRKDKGNRAFTKTGLKILFHFLVAPELINKTQREIAEIAGVALGNIPQVINGLLKTNLILKLNKKEFIIDDYHTLLNKWVTEYEQVLKPTLFKQRFRFLDRNTNWKDLSFTTENTVWGGEPAGDIITNYLRPEKLTLYTKETTKDLMKNYKIIPDSEGDIWVYDMFWNKMFNTKISPLQLVYADLMLTDDKRCKETANIIFNEYIRPNL